MNRRDALNRRLTQLRLEMEQELSPFFDIIAGVQNRNPPSMFIYKDRAEFVQNLSDAEKTLVAQAYDAIDYIKSRFEPEIAAVIARMRDCKVTA